ncbi:MAG: hypothetical protein KTR25_11765 [Myxococcales bacterium]|nr:hypothetical protein [Myxococcales bacterium]
MLWRLGVGTPKTSLIRHHVGAVAANLGDAGPARHAAQALGLPGLYRSPSCWGGQAPLPLGQNFSTSEWSARCQAASFEIAIPIGRPALAFVVENAFGPFEVLQGVALRALLRLGLAGHSDESLLVRAMERIADLEPALQQEALDGLNQTTPHLFQNLHDRLRRPVLEGLELIAHRARTAHAQLTPIDTLARFAPERARRFLPDLKKLLAGEEHALDAALLIRVLEPGDSRALAILRRWADEHPDRKIRHALEQRLKPPQPIPGGPQKN